jgi:hypothetical protein
MINYFFKLINRSSKIHQTLWSSLSKGFHKEANKTALFLSSKMLLTFLIHALLPKWTTCSFLPAMWTPPCQTWLFTLNSLEMSRTFSLSTVEWTNLEVGKHNNSSKLLWEINNTKHQLLIKVTKINNFNNQIRCSHLKITMFIIS